MILAYLKITDRRTKLEGTKLIYSIVRFASSFSMQCLLTLVTRRQQIIALIQHLEHVYYHLQESHFLKQAIQKGLLHFCYLSDNLYKST